MNGAFHAPPLTVPPVFADGQSRRESPKMASPPISILREKSLCFFVSVSTGSGHFVPKSGVGRGTVAFIYALSADETSPALAAPRHAITALLSCCFKCACPFLWQPHFRSNADRAYNTLHFASKVVCQGAIPFGNPGQQNRRYAALSGSIPPFVVSSPFHGLRVVPCKLT